MYASALMRDPVLTPLRLYVFTYIHTFTVVRIHIHLLLCIHFSTVMSMRYYAPVSMRDTAYTLYCISCILLMRYYWLAFFCYLAIM